MFKIFPSFGDLKVLIDWVNLRCIGNLSPQHIRSEITEVKAFFDDITFASIYREFNSQVDRLSREALLMQEGTLTEFEFRGGTIIRKKESSLS